MVCVLTRATVELADRGLRRLLRHERHRSHQHRRDCRKSNEGVPEPASPLEAFDAEERASMLSHLADPLTVTPAMRRRLGTPVPRLLGGRLIVRGRDGGESFLS